MAAFTNRETSTESGVFQNPDYSSRENPAITKHSRQTSQPTFNEEYRAASQRPNTAALTDMTLFAGTTHGAGTNAGAYRNQELRRDAPSPRQQPAPNDSSSPRQQLAPDKPIDRSTRPTDAPSAPGTTHDGAGVNFKNIDASSSYHERTKQIINESISKLNPETQERLKDLNVVTASRIKKVIPDEPEGAGLYTRNEKPVPHTILMAEKSMGNSALRDVLRHELGHPVDQLTNGSSDPGFKDALDKGLQRMPREMRKDFETGFPNQAQMRAEFFADLFSRNLGSTTNQIGYLKGLDQHFPEAKAWIKRKYFDR